MDQQDLALRQLYAQYSEQELNQEFFNQQMELVRTGRFPFSEENLLLMAIINEDDDALRLKKIRSLIAENPSSYDAQLLLEMEHLGVLSPAFYTDFQDFVEWTLKLWRQEGYLDYNYLHSRSHWAGLVFALKVYLNLGYNTAALNLVEKIIAHRAERYAPGFLPLAFAAYLVNGRLDKIDQLYRQVSQKPISMAGPLVYKIFSSLLSGKRERVEKELSHLLQINDEASSFFSGPWQDTVFDYSELEAFVPNSEQSLSIYLLPAMIFLTTNTAINVFLEEEFQNFGPEDTLFGEEFGLTTFRLPDFDELMALDTSQACKGIRYDVVRNLFNFGIKTPEDFKNYTEEDILSIKGIGKMTLQRLKDNGVIFRR